MSQEILDKLDVIINLLRQIAAQKGQHPILQQSAEQQSNIIVEMVKSPDWPEAVPSDLICTASETDKQERAEGIIEMMLPTNIKKFLDFGCGEGHVAVKMSQLANLSVGYDIKQQGHKSWEELQERLLLTTNLDKVKELGPYDVVLIYDVLDHCVNMKEVLSNAKSVLSPGGQIYLRAHPWTGRHGGHLYRQFNKAFAHFLLTKDELATFGANQDPEIVQAIHPIGVYRHWIEKCDLKIETESIPLTIEPYFSNKIIQLRIQHIYQESINKGWSPEWGYEFCDFVLISK